MYPLPHTYILSLSPPISLYRFLKLTYFPSALPYLSTAFLTLVYFPSALPYLCTAFLKLTYFHSVLHTYCMHLLPQTFSTYFPSILLSSVFIYHPLGLPFPQSFFRQPSLSSVFSSLSPPSPIACVVRIFHLLLFLKLLLFYLKF
jgi:hypothetical protein